MSPAVDPLYAAGPASPDPLSVPPTTPTARTVDPSFHPGSSRGSGSARARSSRPATPLGETVAKGLADGFSEASQAFSDEVSGSSSYSHLLENVVSGTLRANARFLEELASVSRRISGDVAGRGQREVDIDYDLLADLIAVRLRAGVTLSDPTIP